MYWAGRPKQLRRIERIIKRLTRRSESTLDIIWANLGAGKSHTLLYLAHRILSENAKNICVVIEVPEHIRNFLDLYQRIARQLPTEIIAETLLNSENKCLREDLRCAARALLHGGTEEKVVASQWLSAEKVDGRELRRLTGIGSKIDSDTAASDILSSVLIALGLGGIRFCLMLDEFQRIEKLQPRLKSRITSSLRSLLSKNPRNLSLFFAISSKLEKTALAVVPAELQTIMGVERPLDLPEMDETEALEFVRDRFKSFRPSEYSGDDFAPMGLAAVNRGIKTIAMANSIGLSPRTILQTMAYLYDEMPSFHEPLDDETASEILDDVKWGDRHENR